MAETEGTQSDNTVASGHWHLVAQAGDLTALVYPGMQLGEDAQGCFSLTPADALVELDLHHEHLVVRLLSRGDEDASPPIYVDNQTRVRITLPHDVLVIDPEWGNGSARADTIEIRVGRTPEREAAASVEGARDIESASGPEAYPGVEKAPATPDDNRNALRETPPRLPEKAVGALLVAVLVIACLVVWQMNARPAVEESSGVAAAETDTAAIEDVSVESTPAALDVEPSAPEASLVSAMSAQPSDSVVARERQSATLPVAASESNSEPAAVLFAGDASAADASAIVDRDMADRDMADREMADGEIDIAPPLEENAAAQTREPSLAGNSEDVPTTVDNVAAPGVSDAEDAVLPSADMPGTTIRTGLPSSSTTPNRGLLQPDETAALAASPGAQNLATEDDPQALNQSDMAAVDTRLVTVDEALLADRGDRASIYDGPAVVQAGFGSETPALETEPVANTLADGETAIQTAPLMARDPAAAGADDRFALPESADSAEPAEDDAPLLAALVGPSLDDGGLIPAQELLAEEVQPALADQLTPMPDETAEPASAEDDYFPYAELTVIRQRAPTYPRRAPEGASGVVDVAFTVTPAGRVADVEVQGDPADYFARAAINAVSRWRFEAVVIDGEPVAVRTLLRLTFRG